MLKRRPRRKALIRRETKEVKIKGSFCLDGEGRSRIDTGIKFFDHMLMLFSFHGLFDLFLDARGDVEHHIIEDIGIAIGDAINRAIGDGKGIRRYGTSYVPMDKVLARVVVDISGRSYLAFSQTLDEREMIPKPPPLAEGSFSFQDVKGFLKALVGRGRINLHIDYKFGSDTHHLLEAIFKALGIALDQATQIDPRRKGIPSTKDTLDL